MSSTILSKDLKLGFCHLTTEDRIGAASPPGEIQIHSSVLFKVFQIQYICYRPQRSCEGYVFTGVCLSTGGGIPACLAACLWGGGRGDGGCGCYPSMHCRWYPSMPCNRSPGGVPGLGGVSTLEEGGLLQGVSGPGGCLLQGAGIPA